MQLLWLRRMPVWLAGPISVLLVLGAALPSHSQSPTTFAKIAKALMYPDGKSVALRYSRVVVEVSISGTHTERDESRVLTETLTLQARVSYVEQPRVRVTARHVEVKSVTTEVDKDTKSVSTHTCALSDTKSTPAKRAGTYQTVPVSKRYGATYFDTLTWNTSPWHNVPGRVVTKVSDSTGEHTFEQRLTCSVLARVPYHSAVGATPFTALARSLEAAGKDGDDMLVGGIMEANWAKGGSFGSFFVPVLAFGGGGHYSVNTKAAMVAESVAPPLFPGKLSVTWVLDTKAPAGR